MSGQGLHKPSKGVSKEVPVQPAGSLEGGHLPAVGVEGYREEKEKESYHKQGDDYYYEAETSYRYLDGQLAIINTSLKFSPSGNFAKLIEGIKNIFNSNSTKEEYNIDCVPITGSDPASSMKDDVPLNKIEGYQINISDNEGNRSFMIIEDTDSNRVKEIYKNLLKKLAEGSFLTDAVEEVAKQALEDGVMTKIPAHHSYGFVTVLDKKDT